MNRTLEGGLNFVGGMHMQEYINYVKRENQNLPIIIFKAFTEFLQRC